MNMNNKLCYTTILLGRINSNNYINWKITWSNFRTKCCNKMFYINNPNFQQRRWNTKYLKDIRKGTKKTKKSLIPSRSMGCTAGRGMFEQPQTLHCRLALRRQETGSCWGWKLNPTGSENKSSVQGGCKSTCWCHWGAIGHAQSCFWGDVSQNAWGRKWWRQRWRGWGNVTEHPVEIFICMLQLLRYRC